jgi:hypothetical protein
MKPFLSLLAVVGLGSVPPTLQGAILANPIITLNSPGFNADFGPANVFDSRDVEYASQGRGFGASLSTTEGTFLEFDFGQSATIDRFVNVTRRNAVDVIITERLIFSSDPVFDVNDPFVDLTPAGSNGNGFIKSFDARTARYVRWEVLDGALTPGGQNANNFGSAEMRFLGPSTGLFQLAPTVIGGATAFNGAFALENAANGDAGRSGAVGIEYASLSLGPDMFVDFDMGSVQPIAGFDFYDRFGSVAAQGFALVDRVNSFDLLFSNDPTFTTGVTTRSFIPGEWGHSEQFDPVNARYVRFDATSTANANSNSGIQDITFYGAIPEPTAGLMLLCGAAFCLRRHRS